jgi:DNA-binding CsgD family transcriptional regulator
MPGPGEGRRPAAARRAAADRRHPAATDTKPMNDSAHSSARSIRRGDALTDRERQILALVAAGERTHVISARLGISQNTIKSHLTRIYKKTGSANRVQAARFYLDADRQRRSDDGRRQPTAPSMASRGVAGQDRERSLLQRQIDAVEARIDELAPAAVEVERLHRALDALRAVEAEPRRRDAGPR